MTTQVNGAASNSSQTAAERAQITREKNAESEFMKAYTDTYNAIHGTKKTTKQIKDLPMAEQYVLFAEAYNELQDTHPNIAKKMLNVGPSQKKALTKQDEKFALFKAVDNFLQDEVKRGSITQNRADLIMKKALGKSELKDGITVINTNRQRLAKNNNLGVLADKVYHSKSATKTQLNAVRKFVEGKRQQVSVPVAETKPPQKPETNSTITGEEATNTEAPKQAKEITESSDFVYKPVSVTDNNALVQIPKVFSKEIFKVVAVDSEDKEIAEFEFSGYNKDDSRAQWRLKSSGSALGSNIKIRAFFIDGGYYDFYQGDGKEYHNESYF